MNTKQIMKAFIMIYRKQGKPQASSEMTIPFNEDNDGNRKHRSWSTVAFVRKS
jgi:hypothetical protein